MELAYLLNIVGLVFDICGAVLLFIYGIPTEISKDGIKYRTTSDIDISEIKKWKKYNYRSKIGLSFIVAGFTVQVFSSILQMCQK